MQEKKIITKFKSKKDFRNEYYFLLNFKKNKCYTEQEVKKINKGKFYKIGEDCFVKLPRLTRKIYRIICASLAGLLVAGAAATVTVFYMPHRVTLKSECLEIASSNTARLAHDYRCTFKIKDEYLPTKYMEDINISSITVNGNKIPAEDYYFTYQNNAKNELIINKKHLGGNIEINADLDGRKQASHRCFFFGYEDFTFEAKDVIYPKSVGDWHNVDGKSTTDNMYLNGVDMAILKAGDDPIHFNYNAFIVREDNAFAIKLHALKGSTLPKNLWFRCYAKFAKKDEDFTITFNNDYTEAILKVNYFVIRDSGSIVPKPDEA